MTAHPAAVPRHLALLFAAAIAGCTLPSGPPAPEYAAAIRASTLIDAAAPPITLRPVDLRARNVPVVTWKTEADAKAYFGYGRGTAGRDVWVTEEPEVHELCARYATDPAALRLRLQQLLGLPPADEQRVFVRILIHPSLLRRPCANPDPAARTCEAAFPQPREHDDVARKEELRDDKVWYAEQVATRYLTAPFGYPWTRLGYTLDWSGNTPHPGVSEFVIRQGTGFKVWDVVSTEAYCHESIAAAPP